MRSSFKHGSSAVLLAMMGLGCSSTSNTAGATSNPSASPLPFQPSNVSLTDIEAVAAKALDESITSNCTIETGASDPISTCFDSPIEPAMQPDGSIVNIVVMSSLTIADGVVINLRGDYPVVLIALGDATISGTLNFNATGDSSVAGGAAGADSNAMGTGPGGGAAGSDSAYIGGGGGSYCGAGGAGGGGTASGGSVGAVDIRPLIGGSSGGGGVVGSGAGGGAVQIVAGGTLTIGSGGAINAGGGGGSIGGLASYQNAGGGGSGGSILLEGTTITIDGTLAANGGGGGGDYSDGTGADGAASSTPAAGGSGGSDDSAGGAGGAGTMTGGAAGTGSVAMSNAGGGGGSVGRIRLNSASGMATVTGTVSPSLTTLCAVSATVRPLSDGP